MIEVFSVLYLSFFLVSQNNTGDLKEVKVNNTGDLKEAKVKYNLHYEILYIV